MLNKEDMIRNLRGAVCEYCEYLDEDRFDEFIEDLQNIAAEEEADFLKKAAFYRKLKKAVKEFAKK
jgi:hypothetical protein